MAIGSLLGKLGHLRDNCACAKTKKALDKMLNRADNQAVIYMDASDGLLILSALSDKVHQLTEIARSPHIRTQFILFAAKRAGRDIEKEREADLAKEFAPEAIMDAGAALMDMLQTAFLDAVKFHKNKTDFSDAPKAGLSPEHLQALMNHSAAKDDSDEQTSD